MSFTPISITSMSIPKSLMEFAHNNKINPKFVDFEIISFQTFLKREHDTDFITVDDISCITENDIKNLNTTITQEYNIILKPAPISNSTINLALSVNALKTKIMLSIKRGSIFNEEAHTIETLKKLIWYEKLKVDFLIDIFEENLEKQLKKVLQLISYEKAISKDIRFTLGLALDPTLPRDTKLEKLYEAKDKDSLLYGVENGELIARYTLSKNGLSGRNCHGKLIPPISPKTIDKKPILDDTVEERIAEDFIEYFAKSNGYVVFENTKLRISQTLKLQEANFKTTANIDTENDNTDISVHIAHSKGDDEDAIGSGVAIDVKDLSVDGSIAGNVTIIAESVNIDAQTHRESKMNVKGTATVKLHRGDLTTQDAIIDTVESGRVTASKSVTVREVLGGAIIAPVIKVTELLSNAVLIASELIEVENIKGNDNKLIIDPNAIETYHSEIQEIKDKIEKETKELNLKKSDLDTKITEHLAKSDRMKTFQKKITQAKKDGKTPMKQDIIRVKQFKRDLDKLYLQKEDLKQEDSKILELETKFDQIANKDLFAKIKSKTLYDGHTQIIFVNVKTREEISFLPEGNIDTISLVLDEENNRVISTD